MALSRSAETVAQAIARDVRDSLRRVPTTTTERRRIRLRVAELLKEDK